MQSSTPRSIQDWINRAKANSTKQRRYKILRNWALANHEPFRKQETTFDNAAAFLLDSMRGGGLDPTESIDRMVKYMIAEKHARSSIYIDRRTIPACFRYCKVPGYTKADFDEDDFNDNVTDVDFIIETTKKLLTHDHLRDLVTAAYPKLQAAIEFIISTGARVAEAASLRVSDIDFTQDPPTITFRPENTKTRQPRQSLLTQEAASIIKRYLEQRPEKDNQWFLPGFPMNAWHGQRTQSADDHMTSNALTFQIRSHFQKIGLGEIDETTGINIYHAHSIRLFHLQHAKSHGFPYDWAEAMAGHKVGVQAHYIPANVTKEWKELVEPYLQVITRPPVIREVRETDPELMQKLTDALSAFAQQTAAINQLRTELSQVREENRLLRERQVLTEKTSAS